MKGMFARLQRFAESDREDFEYYVAAVKHRASGPDPAGTLDTYGGRALRLLAERVHHHQLQDVAWGQAAFGLLLDVIKEAA